MIDMGVVHTLVSQSVARILKLKVAPLQKYDHSVLIAANGSKLELTGSVTLKLYISGLVVHQTAFVAKRRAIAQASFRCGFSLNTKATVSYKGEKGILSLFEDLITVLVNGWDKLRGRSTNDVYTCFHRSLHNSEYIETCKQHHDTVGGRSTPNTYCGS